MDLACCLKVLNNKLLFKKQKNTSCLPPIPVKINYSGQTARALRSDHLGASPGVAVYSCVALGRKCYLSKARALHL